MTNEFGVFLLLKFNFSIGIGNFFNRCWLLGVNLEIRFKNSMVTIFLLVGLVIKLPYPKVHRKLKNLYVVRKKLGHFKLYVTF